MKKKRIVVEMDVSLATWVREKAKKTHPLGEYGNVTQYILSLIKKDQKKAKR